LLRSSKHIELQTNLLGRAIEVKAQQKPRLVATEFAEQLFA